MAGNEDTPLNPEGGTKAEEREDGNKGIDKKEIPAEENNEEETTERTIGGDDDPNVDEGSKQNETPKKRPANDELHEKLDILKPVKRARSAYFIFADEKRSRVQAQVREESFLENQTHRKGTLVSWTDNCCGGSSIGELMVIHVGRGEKAVPRKGCGRTKTSGNCY